MKRISTSTDKSSSSSPDTVPRKLRRRSPDIDVVSDDSPASPDEVVEEDIVHDVDDDSDEDEEPLEEGEVDTPDGPSPTSIMNAVYEQERRRWPADWDDMQRYRRNDEWECPACKLFLDICEDEITEIEKLIVKVTEDGTETQMQIDNLRKYRHNFREKFISACLTCVHEDDVPSDEF